jgi:hypothetical protein
MEGVPGVGGEEKTLFPRKTDETFASGWGNYIFGSLIISCSELWLAV